MRVATVAGVCIFATALLALTRDVKSGYADTVRPGTIETWLALIALQLAGWGVSLGPLVVAPTRAWLRREQRSGLREAASRLLFPLLWVVMVGVFLFAGGGPCGLGAADASLLDCPPQRSYVQTVERHTPLAHHDIATGLLYATALAVVLGATIRLGALRRSFGSDGLERESLHDCSRRLSATRKEARQIVLHIGALISIAIVATGALRTAINEHLAAGGVPETDLLSPSPVILYGAVLTFFLAAAYWPVHAAGRAASERVIERFHPASGCAVDRVGEWMQTRTALEELLGMRESPRETVQAAIGVLAPLAASITASATALS